MHKSLCDVENLNLSMPLLNVVVYNAEERCDEKTGAGCQFGNTKAMYMVLFLASHL